MNNLQEILNKLQWAGIKTYKFFVNGKAIQAEYIFCAWVLTEMMEG